MEDNKLHIEKKIIQTISFLYPYMVRFWEARWQFIIVNFIIAVVASLYLYFFVFPSFESNITIFPNSTSKSMLGNLSELASIAGLGEQFSTQNDIYQELLLSEAVLEEVIFTKYLTDEYQDSVDLITYFDVKVKVEKTPELTSRKKFLKMYKMFIKSMVKIKMDKITKILNVTVTAPESKLSADIVNKMVEVLDHYVRTKRKSNASNQRFYLEKRLSQVKDSLAAAENELLKFRGSNRLIMQSPQLLLTQERLLRNLQISQTVFVELTKQLELVKLDEIRDTPVVNIKEMAREPIVQSTMGRTKLLIIIMTISSLITAAYFIFQEEIRKYTLLVVNWKPDHQNAI